MSFPAEAFSCGRKAYQVCQILHNGYITVQQVRLGQDFETLVNQCHIGLLMLLVCLNPGRYCNPEDRQSAYRP